MATGTVRRGARWLGRGALAVVVGALFSTALVPPFLDRVYHRGPVSDHFDGQRFFNPEGEPPEAEDRRRERGPARMIRFMRGRDRATWPQRVPVTQTVPPRRVDGERMVVTWIGHSTVLVQTAGLNILTDPVWSDRASPVSWAGPKRVRAPGVRFADLPPIDLVLLSHNHYDHLDLDTLQRLWARDRPRIVTPLGNDTILRGAGLPSTARDWNERVAIRPGVDVVVERVHHWGSRFLKDRNRALWGGFTVTLPGGNLFFAGDTGLGDGRWIQLAAAHGPHRLAILPIGAFQPREIMRGSHVDPAEAAAIFQRLGAGTGLAVHWGTFQLSEEPIDAPPERLAAGMAALGLDPARFAAHAVGQSFTVPRLDPPAP